MVLVASRTLMMLAFAFTVVFQSHGDNYSPEPSVLVLASYHASHIWTDQLIQTETRIILDSFPHAHVYVEHMDWKRFPSTKNLESLQHRFRSKYREITFDAIIANDNAALTFAVQNRAELFSDAPIVFAGINGYEEIADSLPDRITGVAEVIEPISTLRTALAIHPQTTTVVIITDRTESGIETRSEIEQSLDSLDRDDVDFRFVDHLSMTEILTVLRDLPPSSFVYMNYFNRDAEGNFFTLDEAIELVTTDSPVPVYHAYGFALDKGIVGGHLLSAVAMGQTAANMVMQVLEGSPPDSLPVMKSNLSLALFDAEVMERFGIPASALPENAEVINQSFTLWDRYRSLLIGILVFIVVQSFVIGALIANTLRRKRAEEALRQSESRFRTLIENSPIAALVVRKGSILYVNDALVHLSGRKTKEELIGRSVLEITGKENHARVVEYIKAREAGNQAPVSYPITGIHASGNRIPLQLFASLVNMDDGPATLVFLTDLRPQKKAEEERIKILQHVEHTQRMESLGVLAGGIAHDLNNLLTGISTNAFLAQMSSDGEREDYFSSLQIAVKRASQLSRQLLTFSRGGEPVKALVALNELIEDSVSFVLRGSRHKAEIALPSELWLVDADSGQVNQVLNNLLINASQAMAHPGTIRVSAENVHLSEQQVPKLTKGDYIRLKIQDTGKGIPPEALPRIFDPFFTTKSQGSGLGLASVYSIVRAHGGGIEVDTRQGQGTTFFVYLPAAPNSTARQIETPSTGSLAASRVLFMDDDEIVRKSLETMLRTLGHEVVAVTDGEHAIDHYKEALAEERKFDLVILDLTIPGGMGGKDTIARIIELDPDVKAIAISGYSTDDVMANCTEYGFLASLSKPFSLEELSSALAKTSV